MHLFKYWFILDNYCPIMGIARFTRRFCEFSTGHGHCRMRFLYRSGPYAGPFPISDAPNVMYKVIGTVDMACSDMGKWRPRVGAASRLIASEQLA
jgi:hypothetical protein